MKSKLRDEIAKIIHDNVNPTRGVFSGSGIYGVEDAIEALLLRYPQLDRDKYICEEKSRVEETLIKHTAVKIGDVKSVDDLPEQCPFAYWYSVGHWHGHRCAKTSRVCNREKCNIDRILVVKKGGE